MPSVRMTLRALLAALAIAALPVVAATAKPAPGSPGHSGLHHKSVCDRPSPGQAQCHAEVVTDDAGAAAVAAAPFGYGPADIQNAYKLPSGGAGQTVAIVDAYDNPYAESDLANYRATYGLAPCTTANGCFKKVSQTGTTSYPVGNVGWGQEISLDLDAVSAACPSCNILLVEASSNSFANLNAAENYAAAHANVVSNSFGGSEFSSETTSTYDGPYNHPGIPITVSSGDDGYGVEYPAASSHVTAVGGTSLNRASNTRGWTESTWSGAGSGCSSYVPKPSWQTDAGCARRTVADVSAVADPNTGVAVYDTYGSSGWMVFGGTSLSAPIVASVYALIGNAGPAGPSYFYGHLGNVFDVTSGSNGSCGGSYLCTAVAGFDGPTGLGTPNLAGAVTPPTVNAPTATTGAASSVGQTSATLGGTVNPGGGATTYHFEYGTTTGYGSVTPNTSAGSGTTASPVSAAVTGLTAGATYHFRLVATNSAGTSTGGDATFTTTATAPPTSHTTPASSTTILRGTYYSGSVAGLAASDGSYYVVRGSTTDWYGQMTGVSNAATSISFTFSALSSSACTQTLRAYNYTTGLYTTLDTRTLSTTQQSVTVALGGSLADYVSGTSGTGTVTLRAACSGSSHRYSSDLMQVTWVG